MAAEQKRKQVHNTLPEKAKTLKDIEDGLSNKDLKEKYNVPKIPYQQGQK